MLRRCTYESPLGHLRFPQDVGDPIVNLGGIHALHGPHRSVVQAVRNPAPIDELLHHCLEHRDGQPGKASLDRHPLQEVEVDVAERGVDEEAERHGPSGAGEIVLEVLLLLAIGGAVVFLEERWHHLGDAVADPPEDGP